MFTDEAVAILSACCACSIAHWCCRANPGKFHHRVHHRLLLRLGIDPSRAGRHAAHHDCNDAADEVHGRVHSSGNDNELLGFSDRMIAGLTAHPLSFIRATKRLRKRAKSVERPFPIFAL